MGWSCSKAASDTLQPLWDYCVRSNNNGNTWRGPGGVEFFAETSRREYDDGAITGHIVELGPAKPDGARYGRKVGSFRVNGDGTIARMPRVMRLALDAGKAGVAPFFASRGV
jgi:hypothetical protein